MLQSQLSRFKSNLGWEEGLPVVHHFLVPTGRIPLEGGNPEGYSIFLSNPRGCYFAVVLAGATTVVATTRWRARVTWVVFLSLVQGALDWPRPARGRWRWGVDRVNPNDVHIPRLEHGLSPTEVVVTVWVVPTITKGCVWTFFPPFLSIPRVLLGFRMPPSLTSGTVSYTSGNWSSTV